MSVLEVRSTAVVRDAELLRVLVERQLRLRSKRSVLGVVWPIVAPLFLLAIYSFVYGRIFDISVRDYPAYLFAGLLPWTFLVQALHDALQSISFEPDLVRRAPFRYELLPVARVVVMFIPFVLLLGGFVAWLAATRGVQAELLPLLLVPIVALVLVVTSLSILVALLDVFNRELRFVLNNLLTVWFFLVPIVYRPGMGGDLLHALRYVDPMQMVVEQFRDVLYRGEAPGAGSTVLLLGLAMGSLVVTLLLFRRFAAELPKEV